MNEFEQKLRGIFDAYRHTSEYKDRSMVEIMWRREEFEKNLDEMWAICLKGYIHQIPEYKKGVQQIKEAGLTVLRNSAGKHKIVHKKS